MRLQQITNPCKSPHGEPADAGFLWAQFLEARAIAMKSLEIADGIRAGRAWSKFLGAFASPIAPGQPE